MSELILNWLNEQIQLTKRITSFQEDFNNGFLFGELLSKYNQQLNFSEFLNKDDKKSKLKNFQLLFDTLSALKVTFSSSIANDIINKKSGVAKKLLYELKMNLQKTLSSSQTGNAFSKMTKMTKTLSPLKKIKVSKEQYDKVEKQHFVKQLNQLHPAQKSINQQKLLRKFSDFHERQVITNIQLGQKQQDVKLFQQRKFRQKQRDNLKKTADFRNEWQRSNIQKWQANMTVRHIQNEKDTMFKTRLQQTKFQNKTMSELNAIKSMDKDINDFQRKFIKGANKKKKISQISDSDESNQANNNLGNVKAIDQQPQIKKKQSKLQSKLKFPSNNSPRVRLDSPSKTNKLSSQNEQQKHQREKKRRKMIVQQNKRYQLIEISRRQKYILSTIQQTSKQQKELEYEIWRVWQNKEVIKENKRLQEEKQKEKNEVRQINAKFKRDELLKTYRQEHEVQVNQSVIRQQKLLKDHAVAQRKSTYQQCKNIVQQFLTVTEQLFLNQQQTNSLQLSPNLIDHLFSEFVEGITDKNQIAELEIKNYIHGNGEWNLKPMRKSQEQPTQPTQDNSLPQKPVNNFYLGNILRFLYENKFNMKNSEKQNSQNKLSSSECLISLIGPQFSGKHIAALALQENHNFNVIQIQKLIFKKIQQYEEIKDRVSQISEDTKNIVELAYAGKDIPNDLIIKLIKQQVIKNPRSVLLNFPISYNQALGLTNQLSGVRPSDFIPKSEFENKVESFSRLVWPTESKIVPKPIRQCGVDLALWVDITDKQSYDRFLGRRWIDDKIVSIHDDIADNVRKLQVADKASPEVLKNYKKLVQKQKIQQFFNQFGIQVKALESQVPKQIEQFRQEQRTEQQVSKQNLHQILKSWSQIDGQCSIEQLQKKILSKMQQVMKIKTKKREQQILEQEKKKNKEEQKAQNDKKQEELKQKCVFTEQQVIRSKLTNALQSLKLPQQFTSQIISVWQSVQSSTISSLRQCFEFIKSQKQSQLDYISQTKRNFINMLTRDDKKFSLVKKFQIDYNKFLDQNKQMISQQFTKEQLHQRVDDLQEELFDIIEQKKQDAIEEKKNNAESGWLESQLQQFYQIVRTLLQAQLNRYNCSEKILNDFYSKKYAVTQNPTEDNNTIQINYDPTLQMITKDGQFPRLQKLLSQTLRLFNRQEEAVDDKGKKGGKAPPPKKDDKKGGKKVQAEEPKEPTLQQIQLKKAINIEKSIFRYRVSIISQFSQQKLSQFVKKNQSLYKDLESYYLYTYDIENKCVFNLSKIFRKKIEMQEKIENEIAVEYVDVIQNQKIRNFQKQKPIILPAKEEKIQNRLTVANALQLIQLLRNEAESKQKLSSKRLIQILKYLKNNLTEKQILPFNWKSLQDEQIQRFVNSLDSENLGHVQLWKIIVFIVLTNCSMPNNKELQEYFNELTAFGTLREVTKQKFIGTKAWFDEQYKQIENVRTFKRNQQIKGILFDLFKFQTGQQEYIEADKVCKSLGLYDWLVIEDFGSGKTYFDVAFIRE